MNSPLQPAGDEENARDPDDSPVIRVLTLNAHQGLSALGRRPMLTAIRDGLRETKADLVFLQEVGGDDQAAHQYELLADRVWSQHAYGRNAVSPNGHQGNALLSRFPISSWQNVDVSIGTAEPRGVLHCVIEVPQCRRALHAVCVHFGLREAHRRRQADLLLEMVSREIPAEDPLVIAGDFNDWRQTIDRRLLAIPHIAGVHASASGRNPRTFPARWPILRLDRIYVRHVVHRPLDLPRRPWSLLSDHIPLAADIQL